MLIVKDEVESFFVLDGCTGFNEFIKMSSPSFSVDIQYRNNDFSALLAARFLLWRFSCRFAVLTERPHLPSAGWRRKFLWWDLIFLTHIFFILYVLYVFWVKCDSFLVDVHCAWFWNIASWWASELAKSRFSSNSFQRTERIPWWDLSCSGEMRSLVTIWFRAVRVRYTG